MNEEPVKKKAENSGENDGVIWHTNVSYSMYRITLSFSPKKYYKNKWTIANILVSVLGNLVFFFKFF